MNRRDLLSSFTLLALNAEAQESATPPAPSLYIPNAHRVEDRKLLHDFMEEVPAATRTALSGNSAMNPAAAFDLYRRFAREWIKAFA